MTAWRAGWAGRLLALTLFPELFYDAFLDLVYVRSIMDITLARSAQWGHVRHAPVDASPTTAEARP